MFEKIKLFLDRIFRDKEYLPDGYFGSKFIDHPQDFEFVGDIDTSNIPRPRYTFDMCNIQYDQNLVHKYSCSAHGTACALSNNTGRLLTTAEIKNIWDQEVNAGNASPLWGGYTYKMVDAYRTWYNNNYPEDKIISIAIPLGTELMEKVLDLGYCIAMGYANYKNYNDDWFTDGKLDKMISGVDKIEYGEYQGGGHCLMLTKSPLKNVDNYVLTRQSYNNNIYTIDLDKVSIKDLVNNGVWHKTGYIFMYINDIKKPIEKVVNQKLLERLSTGRIDAGRFLYCKELNKFAFVQNNEITVLTGRDISEGFKFPYGKSKETFTLGVSEKDLSSMLPK